MSSSTWVNYAIGIVGGIAVGFLTAGVGLGAYATMAGLATFAVTSSLLNAKYATPRLGGLRPPSGFGNAGGQTGIKDAAAASIQVNSSSEGVILPVVFGQCRVSANITRYDVSTFRAVPIIERVQRDPGQVAYEMALRRYKRNPSSVNHQIDRAAEKQAAGQAGGKGGADSPPPPSQSYDNNEKVQAYTQVILEQSNGGRRLPKEYDEYIVGYNYYLSWELAVCMGPVDGLHGVRVYPGEFATVDRYASPDLVSAETVLTGSGGEQGGTIRFYRGTDDQTRNVADPYATPFTNYRNVAFATMQDYWMGQSPGPSSYAFEVERIPVCLDADGDPVEGLICRGSEDTGNTAYHDANPAAIIWEIFTNKLWGKGLDPNLLDQASFVKASEYFAAEGLGMSFSMESQTLVTEAIETIRAHVATTVVWYGGRLYCRCLLDRSDAYSPMIILTSDNISGSPSVSRPAWPSTAGELRATFMNRMNNFASEVAIAQDLANIATVGRINSTTVDLPAFSTRAIADKAVKRMLLEMSYPQATLEFKMNRFETRLQPGGFLAFIWSEWSDGPITTYWRVMEISDGDQDGAGVRVVCAEDLYATPQMGAITDFTPPVPAFEGQTANDDADLYYGENHSAVYDAGPIDLQIVEMPISLADADRTFALFSLRNNGQTRGLKIHWRETGDTDWNLLGIVQPWATTGTLTADIPAAPSMTRNADWEVTLRSAASRGQMLELCSTAPTPSDPLDIVTGSSTNLLRVGDEIMLVAQAEAGSAPDRVRIKAVLRGQFGTPATPHSAGEPMAFLYEFVPYVMTLRYDQMPLGVSLDFQATPFDRWSRESTPVVVTHTLTNRARKALPVETWSAVVAGLDWEVSFRPRFHNRGVEAVGDFTALISTLTGAIPEGYEFYVMPRNGGTALLAAPVKMAVVFTPDDGLTSTSGMVAFDYTAPATTTNLVLYPTFDGVLGFPTTLTP